MVSDCSDALRAEGGREVERAWTVVACGLGAPSAGAAAAAHACESTVRRWENPGAGRYYEARLVRDLFGDWQVLRVWGGIGTPRGAMRFSPLTGPRTFAGELERIDKRRRQRGYLPRP